MPKYIHITPDNTKANFIEIPVNISDECWTRLNKCGLANAVLDENGNRNIFKFSLEYFHPKRWIPAVVPGEKPISPLSLRLFVVVDQCKTVNAYTKLEVAVSIVANIW